MSDALTADAPPRRDLWERYRVIRDATRRLCEPLEAEDCLVQSMPDVSPTKWHLAHTTWFFETFVLGTLPGYRPFHPEFGYLFNSYYQTVGSMHERARRGMLSRPTLREVWDYRAYVDAAMESLWRARPPDPELRAVWELGLQHEQQHQELILTDIQHVLWCNPLRPAYRAPGAFLRSVRARELHPQWLRPETQWCSFDGGLYEMGCDGDDSSFAFDNEGPRHRHFLEAFQLGACLVTQGEYLEFMQDGGYERVELWLSEGWDTVREQGWQAPLYWERQDGVWRVFTLEGMRSLDFQAPVAHVSYYEADAFARWKGVRLPTEAEWEVAATTVRTQGLAQEGNFVETGALQPLPVVPGESGLTQMLAPRLAQMFGDVWEWTRSPYAPYPGFRPARGALGEYNGKFMCNQLVLKGGSCATPASHIRSSYRNFFPPTARWQFSGIRVARDAGDS